VTKAVAEEGVTVVPVAGDLVGHLAAVQVIMEGMAEM
jgi:hypothetical protein